jgi:Na+-driven multidrug efflux pump
MITAMISALMLSGIVVTIEGTLLATSRHATDHDRQYGWILSTIGIGVAIIAAIWLRPRVAELSPTVWIAGLAGAALAGGRGYWRWRRAARARPTR